MRRAKEKGMAPGLRTLRERVEQWRAQREGQSRLPEDLWDEAARMARVAGLNVTAKALRFDYYDLKKRMELVPCAPAGVDKRDQPLFCKEPIGSFYFHWS